MPFWVARSIRARRVPIISESRATCLVTSVRDILETVAPILGRPPAPPPIELAAAAEHRPPEPLPEIRRNEHELIVLALGPSPVDIDELIRATGVATRKVHIARTRPCWPVAAPRPAAPVAKGLRRAGVQPLLVFSLLASSSATLIK